MRSLIIALISLTAISSCKSADKADSNELKHLLYQRPNGAQQSDVVNSAVLIGSPCASQYKSLQAGEDGLDIIDTDRMPPEMEKNEEIYFGWLKKKKTHCIPQRDIVHTENDLSLMGEVAQIFEFNWIRSKLFVPMGAAGYDPEHDSVAEIMQRTADGAKALNANGTMLWYFSGHSSPTHFAVNHQRFTISTVIQTIKDNADDRLKRLVILLDTCYAGRVVNGNDQIERTDLSAAEKAEIRTKLESDIRSQFQELYPEKELVVLVATHKNGYSYYDARGGFFTRSVHGVTKYMYGNEDRREKRTISNWIASISSTTFENVKKNFSRTITGATQVSFETTSDGQVKCKYLLGLRWYAVIVPIQIPRALVLPDSLNQEKILSGGGIDNSSPPVREPRKLGAMLSERQSEYYGQNNARLVLVYVDSVIPGSLAEKLGVIAGDWVVYLNGTNISNRADIAAAMTAPGRTVTMTVFRGRETVDLSATIDFNTH